jgi:predicted nucleic acid-binding Zn finger protein
MGYKGIREYIESVKNRPPERVREALVNRRVIKVSNADGKTLWAFRGKQRDYFIIPGLFCTCKDFEINVVMRKLRGCCYHLISADLAVERGEFREISVDNDLFFNILYELIINGVSPSLRKALSSIK